MPPSTTPSSADETAADASLPCLSCIVPVRDGARFLERSLPPLLARLGREVREVIVVDDASSDDSTERAEALGARVLHTGDPTDPRGPAAARNLGAREASGEVLMFVDADVVVHDDAVPRMAAAFGDAGVAAVFGRYDDAPPERGFASLYMNLRHHRVHSASPGEHATFWAGCGAVRADVFRRVGGFDAERYRVPCIEDIELGYRITAVGGRILLCPGIQATHLKRWTWAGVVRTDVLQRALPWGRLLATGRYRADALNVAGSERTAAVVAALLAAAIVAALVGAASPLWALALLALAAVLNRDLLRLFAERGGPGFAVAGLLQHQLYYLYATATFAWCHLERAIGRSDAGAAERRG